MSWQVYLTIDTGGEEPHKVFEFPSLTFNYNQVYTLALGHSIRELSGQYAVEAGFHIDQAIKNILDDIDRYKLMLSRSVDIVDAMRQLRAVQRKCDEHPNCILRIY